MDNPLGLAAKWKAVADAMGAQLAAARAVVAAWAELGEATPLDARLDALDRAIGDLDVARKEAH